MSHLLPRRAVTLLVALVSVVFVISGCTFHGAYDLPLPGNQVSSSDGYQVTADFNDVISVVPRTVVMANDVPVGQVDDVERVGWHARVTMTIRKDIVLPKDATADVRQTSLLGEKYIQLSAPSGSSVAKQGRLANGDHIPLSHTSRNPEVEEVLGALSFLLSGGGVGQLKTISSELNKAMDGRQADVRHVFGQINDLVASLDSQKSDIIAAMSALNRLTGTLNREKQTIGAALDSFGPALQVLNQQHQSLMRMLRAMDRLGVVGGRVIRESKDNLVASLRHLAPTLRQLANAGNSLPRGLMMAASFPFPKQAASLAKGDYSNALFRMDFNLNKVLKGALTGGNTGLPDVAQLCKVYSGQESCAQLTAALCQVLRTNVFCGTNPKGPPPTGPGLPNPLSQHKKKTSLQHLLDGLGAGTGGLLGGSGAGGGSSGSGTGSGSGGGLLGLFGGGS